MKATAAKDMSDRSGGTGQVRDPARYRIINEHGRGGLGRVSRAYDRDLGRDVAIKELISRNNISEARFRREALITARLEHPGIVPVHEAGRWPDGTPFYAMKLVAGRPLRELIAERTSVDERISLLHHLIAVADAIAYAISLLHHLIAVADAIAYAHGRKIIHRDLKPANVIVGDFGETVVIDWGLAKDLSVSEEAATADGPVRTIHDYNLTAAGRILGTPTYMAPEQERGEPVDQRADVFAIGAMLWELCSLHRVPPSDIARRHRMLRRAHIDGDLAAIMDKALDPDRRRRYRDAGALAADLKAFKSGARITARRYSLPAMLAHWTRRHRLIAISMIAFIVLAALLGVVATSSAIQTRMAEELVTQAEIERGQQALIHGESSEAVLHLENAYQRGDHSPGVAFMLARSLQPRMAELGRLTSSSGRMWSAMFSPDGKRIVTSDDKSARMWDAGSSQLLFTMSHGDIVYQAIFSPDGHRVITAGGDGTVRIWDAATGAPMRELTWLGARQWRYCAVAMSSHFVAAIDLMGEVAHVWDVDAGTRIAALDNDAGEVGQLAFTGDGRWLATSGGDDVRVFDTSTWRQAVTLAGPSVRSLSFDPTGQRLAVGRYGGDASIWEIPSGVRVRCLREAGESVDAIAFSRDGALVATGSRDGAEQVWDAKSGGLRTQFNSHHSKIYAVEFASTGNLLLSAGADSAVVVSNVATGMPVARLEGPKGLILAAHFDSQSRRVVGASWDGTSRVWDASSPYLRWGSSPIGVECETADSLEPDQRFIALSCRNHGTHIWDTARGELLAELPAVTTVEGDYYSAFPALTATGDRAAIAQGNSVQIYALPSAQLLRTIAHPSAVNAVAFAPAGHDLVSGAVDGSLILTRDDREPFALPPSATGIDAAALLADGRVVVIDANARLRLIDPNRNSLVMDLAAPSRVRLLRPSPEGTHLVTISVRSKQAPPALWDLDQRRFVAQLDGHVGRVFTARFVTTEHGPEILTAGADGTVRLWNATNGSLSQTFRGDSHFLADATLAPDGSVVVAGGSDGLLRFWDTSSGRLLWALQTHKSYVIGVHYEGAEIVTRGFAGDISRWRLPPPDSVIEACHASTCASAALREKAAR